MTDFIVENYFDIPRFIMNVTCEYDIYNKINTLTIENSDNAISDIKREYFSEGYFEITDDIEDRLIVNFNGRIFKCFTDQLLQGNNDGVDMIRLTYGSRDNIPTSNGIDYFEFVNIYIYNDNRPIEIQIGSYLSLTESEGVLDWFDESSYFDSEGIKSENHFFPKGNCLSDYKLIVRVN